MEAKKVQVIVLTLILGVSFLFVGCAKKQPRPQPKQQPAAQQPSDGARLQPGGEANKEMKGSTDLDTSDTAIKGDADIQAKLEQLNAADQAEGDGQEELSDEDIDNF